jgi:hypothetical protein
VLGAVLEGTAEETGTSGEATPTTAAGWMTGAGGGGGGALFFFEGPDPLGGTLFVASPELGPGSGGDDVAPPGGALLLRLSPGGTLRFFSEETMVPGKSAFFASSVSAVCPPSPTMVALRFAFPAAFDARPPEDGAEPSSAAWDVGREGDGALIRSGTSLARCHLGMPPRQTSVVGGRTPLANASRSSSVVTTR